MEKMFWAKSIFGARTRKPLVELSHGDWSCQLDPFTARKIATDILTAAEAAEQDAFLVRFIQHTLGGDEETAFRVLIEYRTWREEQWRAYERRRGVHTGAADEVGGAEGPAGGSAGGPGQVPGGN